jgi:hypothetical protein
MSQDNLKEMLSHPGWGEYLDVIKAEMLAHFMEIFQLDPTNPDSFVKFVEIKSKIDTLRDITYFIERQVVDHEEIVHVDQSYGQRFLSILKKLGG